MMPKAATKEITIKAPNLMTLKFVIEGTVDYVQHKFSARAKEAMRAAQEAGSTARSSRSRTKKDFQALFQAAQHISEEGWCGIPAPGLRNAMISACRLASLTMASAKLAVFVEMDGVDAEDGTPLVRITRGEPQYFEAAVRNATGVADLRVRPRWKAGWQAEPRVTFDADVLTPADVTNLLARAGAQVGLGDGRPDSRRSSGQGWGLFHIINDEEEANNAG